MNVQAQINLDKYHCNGCSACISVCPKHAITMQSNLEGFLYPTVDSSLCNDCGMCIKTCQQAEDLYWNLDIEDASKSPEAFAVQIKDTETLKNSSSGAAFSLLMQFVFEKKGVVFGSCFDENWQLIH